MHCLKMDFSYTKNQIRFVSYLMNWKKLEWERGGVIRSRFLMFSKQKITSIFELRVFILRRI